VIEVDLADDPTLVRRQLDRILGVPYENATMTASRDGRRCET